ncbi:unnamed protein product [Rhizophagus irregularis]|uniref:Uncharacterized protein n=1 Tax=Rhizophagus irregularis TaxID=588596 RepID=A0A916E2P4_9GLOM|nr:unnamed protein product [Rhizophagus irregularis]
MIFSGGFFGNYQSNLSDFLNISYFLVKELISGIHLAVTALVKKVVGYFLPGSVHIILTDEVKALECRIYYDTFILQLFFTIIKICEV